MRTTHKMIAHLPRNGVFVDDPDMARVGGTRAVKFYYAHWVELDRMRDSDQ